ncbi:MAG: hypothetical protein SGI86_00855 [Deltaproteobacteria bacterium]|nr:hypothetical protein [Deltaproteobacteria bacterium]
MRFPASIATILVLARVAFGWGGEGHQAVALLAENRLTPKAQAEVHDLLGKGYRSSVSFDAAWTGLI